MQRSCQKAGKGNRSETVRISVSYINRRVEWGGLDDDRSHHIWWNLYMLRETISSGFQIQKALLQLKGVQRRVKIFQGMEVKFLIILAGSGA
jgi:hypothetical protein